MHRKLAITLLPLSLLAAPAVPAQDATPPQVPPGMAEMMQAYQKAATPGAPHAALAKMAGDYELSIRSWHTPDGAPTVESGKATRTMALGGRVMVEQVQSQMHGQPFEGHGMHGYDNVTGRHWATWTDNMSTGLMLSDGTCTADGACTFTGSWNDPVTGDKVNARMTSRWTSPTVEVFEMHGPGPDGKEGKMMEITYTKK